MVRAGPILGRVPGDRDEKEGLKDLPGSHEKREWGKARSWGYSLSA